MFNKSISIVLFSLLLIAGTALAGGEAGNFGLGFAVAESTPTFTGSYWVSNSFVLEPSFALSSISLDDGRSATQIIPGIGILNYMHKGKDTRPFVGFRLMFNMYRFNDHSYSDLHIGPVLGITHYFSNQFAISGEYQLNIISPDNNYSPDQLTPGATYIQTVSLLRVHLYF